MDRNLALEFVRVTEAAAIASSAWIGRGDKKAADQAAVDAMRTRLNQIDFSGTITIGEGEKDEAPMLYTGEKVGTVKGPVMDLAVDPLEATDSVANGTYNAISVIAAGAKNSLLHAPDTYMNKIAVGPQAVGAVSLDAPIEENLSELAQALNKEVSDLTVIVLNRPRHKDLIDGIRLAGARVRLITDGDVAGAIAPSLPESGIDALMGIGASTEGVLAAAAIKILGGEILCQFTPKDKDEEKKLKKYGIDTEKIYATKDLARGDNLTFTATGVIDGPLVSGVRVTAHHIITHSIVARARSRTVRYITTHHHKDNL